MDQDDGHEEQGAFLLDAELEAQTPELVPEVHDWIRMDPVEEEEEKDSEDLGLVRKEDPDQPAHMEHGQGHQEKSALLLDRQLEVGHPEKVLDPHPDQKLIRRWVKQKKVLRHDIKLPTSFRNR